VNVSTPMMTSVAGDVCGSGIGHVSRHEPRDQQTQQMNGKLVITATDN